MIRWDFTFNYRAILCVRHREAATQRTCSKTYGQMWADTIQGFWSAHESRYLAAEYDMMVVSWEKKSAKPKQHQQPTARLAWVHSKGNSATRRQPQPQLQIKTESKQYKKNNSSSITATTTTTTKHKQRRTQNTHLLLRFLVSPSLYAW